ncbi:MAG TPA: NAD(P)H-hydrate epimerase, partial [Candidatus Methanomethylicus sp.]|nr:NAD(P)H-hydrate epimerase [Candidatus Methanomethylicus sp.]
MDAILPEEAKALDENAGFLGIKMLQLMENAGRGVVERTSQLLSLKGKDAVVLSYTGNKGGDGFVIARHLSSLGTRVLLLLLAKPNQIATEEAKTNFEIASKLRSSVRISVAQTPSDLALFKEEISSADLVVDAMLGTGS